MPSQNDFAANQTQPAATEHPVLTGPGSAAHADRRAHAFFWCELTVAAAISITGNATHAVLHAQTLAALAAAVAIVPPIALLTAVHGVTILPRAHARTRTIHTLATLMTVLITIGAFRLSFTALRDLAGTAGVPNTEAWLWPLIIEGSMAQATVAILALAHSPRAQTPPSSAPCAAFAPNTLPIDGYHFGAGAEVVRAHGDNAPTDTLAIPEISCAPFGGRPPTGRWPQIAATICDRDPARRRDPAEVALVLSMHFDHGRTPTQISREIRRSRSAISRIISDAVQLEANCTSHSDSGRDC